MRDDPAVIAIAVPAMRVQCAALVSMPMSVCANMMFQSIGLSGRATLMSSLRSGACFIPLVLVLSRVWGLPGIMYSQPISDVLSALIAVPFVIHFFRRLPREDT